MPKFAIRVAKAIYYSLLTLLTLVVFGGIALIFVPGGLLAIITFTEIRPSDQSERTASFALSSESRADESLPCDAFETVYPGNDAYNELVCKGWDAFDGGQYQEAMSAFRRADEMDLFEFPNFKLLPIMALTASRLGDDQLGNQLLHEAELTLFIANGEMRCVSQNDGFRLYRQGQKLAEPQPENVIQRMCGDLYETLYRLQKIEDSRWRTELNENYLHISDQILE